MRVSLKLNILFTAISPIKTPSNPGFVGEFVAGNPRRFPTLVDWASKSSTAELIRGKVRFWAPLLANGFLLVTLGVGNSNIFLFSPRIPKGMIQFDLRIFFKWVG